MAMTYDPSTDLVTAFCNGEATPTQITDPVAEDVFEYGKPIASNPYHFPWPFLLPVKSWGVSTKFIGIGES